jgi:hypothetical protein
MHPIHPIDGPEVSAQKVIGAALRTLAQEMEIQLAQERWEAREVVHFHLSGSA